MGFGFALGLGQVGIQRRPRRTITGHGRFGFGQDVSEGGPFRRNRGLSIGLPRRQRRLPESGRRLDYGRRSLRDSSGSALRGEPTAESLPPDIQHPGERVGRAGAESCPDPLDRRSLA